LIACTRIGLDRIARVDRGVVDQDLDRSFRVEQGSDGGFQPFEIGQIAGDGLDLVRDALRVDPVAHRCGGRLRKVMQDDAGTGFGETEANLLAQSPGAAGHQSKLVDEVTHMRLLRMGPELAFALEGKS
jgi:hypothetical protein